MLPAQLKGEVISAFMGATRTVFIIFVPVSIVVGILSLFVEVETPHRKNANFAFQDVRLGESNDIKKLSSTSSEMKIEKVKEWPEMNSNTAILMEDLQKSTRRYI